VQFGISPLIFIEKYWCFIFVLESKFFQDYSNILNNYESWIDY